ncbi:ROK family protein [Leifsonia poae]|uniref:Sugar kinase n=1 Tax=Leifsonia poae TaxID=110933 RepID=A0A9W6H9L5_9MICO|nr:ROK family protein [Leifsonia poae]GLJ76444.1 sugar kinase [Leifsonia poae]
MSGAEGARSLLLTHERGAGTAVLAVDLGGTAMKGAVVSDRGETLVELTRPTPASEVVGALISLFRDLGESASGLGCRVVGAGVATPGMIDEERGIVRYASNLDWRDVPLRDALRDALDVPVALGHDVRAAGVAERLIGAARGTGDFVLVPIGTGVAAALVTAGGTVTGATGAAGEFGHIPVVIDGEQCTCGQRGCLEVYVSGAGLARRYAAAGGPALSSREIVARLGSDAVADRVWTRAVDVLAQGLNILTLLLDPEVIVLGGGFSRAGDALMIPLTARMSAGLAWRERPRVVRSELGGDAGRTGAAILAFRAAGLEAVADEWRAVIPTP